MGGVVPEDIGSETLKPDLFQKGLAPPSFRKGQESRANVSKQAPGQTEHLPLGSTEERRGGNMNNNHEQDHRGSRSLDAEVIMRAWDDGPRRRGFAPFFPMSSHGWGKREVGRSGGGNDSAKIPHSPCRNEPDQIGLVSRACKSRLPEPCAGTPSIRLSLPGSMACPSSTHGLQIREHRLGPSMPDIYLPRETK